MACADAADPDHARCCEARDSAILAGHLLFTSDYVVDETLTLIRMRLGVKATEAWCRQCE